MRSVADRLRTEDRDAVRALAPGERVALALALGARDLATFCAAHQPPLPLAEGATLLQRRRQAGRRASRCVEELIG